MLTQPRPFFKITSLTIITLITAFIFTGRIIAREDGGKSGKKKKIYISSITPKGVDAMLAERVKEGIRLAIFAVYGARYHVLDDEAIKVMYAQAEEIMASGCNDTSCITQIAEGINADEVIYGSVSQERTKLAMNITCLERKGVSLGMKSIAKISFYESQLDYAASEAAKKLMNLDYKIDMSKAPMVAEAVALGGIQIKAVAGSDIPSIQFKSDDETVEKIIDYSKGLVSKGDEFFNKQKYPDARGKYFEIIEKVKTKLTADKKEKIQDYINDIHKRIGSTYIMQYKGDIDGADKWLKGIKNPQENDLEGGLKKYEAVETEVNRIQSPYDDSRSQLLSAIRDRKDSIHLAVLAGWEKTADGNYRDYKFDDAIKLYRRASDRTGSINDGQKKSETNDRIQKKIGTTQSTGEGYVVNRTKSLVDQAEFYNFQDKISEAKSMMEEARKFITGPMRIFVTAPALENFNNYAKVLNIDQILSDDEKNRQAYDENRRRDEELASRRRAEADAESQSQAWSRERKAMLSARSPFIRLGYGGFGLINLADSDLNKYYDDNQAFMFECDFFRMRDDGGDGFDLFGRYMLRRYKMTDTAFEDFQSSPPDVESGFIRDYPISKSTLSIHGFDAGIRYSVGAYFLYERWDAYLGAAYRLLYASEKAESGLSNSFWSSGIIGSAGFEVTLTAFAGLFAEFEMGYVPVGKSKKNVEGSQVLFGATFRMGPVVLE